MLKAPLLKFTIIFILSLIGLYFIFTPFKSKYEKLIVSYGNKICNYHVSNKANLGRVAGVMTEQKPNGETYIKIGTANVKEKNSKGDLIIKSTDSSLMTFIYLPMILTLAFILATPFSIWKKIIGVILAIILVHGFIYLKLLLILLTVNNGDLAVVAGYSGFTISILSFLFNMLIGQTSLGTSIVVALVLWIIIIATLTDIKKVFEQFIAASLQQSKTK
ncbi:MAG: hypothetical protein HW421_2812 [Ignavibacteria bacterium]|nr:hypothetical protein [Ignavibacteria bacterium]